MTSTLWVDPYETLGVARDAQLTTINLTYCLRLRSHILNLYENPTTTVNSQREFQKVQKAYEVLIKKNELKRSIQAIIGGELQQLKECWKILLQNGKPISDKIQQDKNLIDGLTRDRWSTVYTRSTQSRDLLDRVQPGWLIGILSCIQLLFELISILLASTKGTWVRYNHPKHAYIQYLPRTPLFGVSIEKGSQQVDVELPLIVAGQRFMATPDMGSIDNVMSASVAKQLRLKIEDCFLCVCMGNKFTLANGHVITCKGTLWTRFDFPSEELLNFPIRFHVLESLAISVIVGRKFLHKTRTLTTHLNRLVPSPRPYGMGLSPPRILHIKSPHRILKCFINGTSVRANVDIRVEMNFASPEFAAHSRILIGPVDQPYQFVQLADGSITSISGCFRARFNPFDKPSTKTLRPGARMQTFYILEGLTSDVLLGRQLVHEMYASVNQIDQTNAFFNMKRQDLHDDLNVIAWLEEWGGIFGSHSVEHDSLDVKYSTFWCFVQVNLLNECNQPHQVQTCLTEADMKEREHMRQKQELYLQKRQQAVEARKKEELPMLEWISQGRASLNG